MPHPNSVPPQPALQPPHRSWKIRYFNRAGALLDALGLALPRIDEAALLAQARRQTGLDDFGPDTYREGLRVLIDSLQREANLNQIGRIMARYQILHLLVERLRFIDYRKRHPELAEEKIERPLFVLGLPRTGTTILYGLLAQDPAHRSPRSWEVHCPTPPPMPELADTDSRIAEYDKHLDLLRKFVPHFDRIHPMAARLPQECISITAYEFQSLQFEMSFHIPSYSAWHTKQSLRSAYRLHSEFLQHLQSKLRKTRWVLKSPAHLNTLEDLFAQYPDALVVQTHRNPCKVIPSVASLEYTLRTAATDVQDPRALGRQQLELWSHSLQNGLRARDAHPERAAQFFDLSFADILRDPLDCVARIYRHFDLELTEEAETKMRQFLAENQREKHGTHLYTLEMFGLASDEVERAFRPYIERFALHEAL